MRHTAMIRSLKIGHNAGKSQGILKWKMSGNPVMARLWIQTTGFGVCL